MIYGNVFLENSSIKKLYHGSSIENESNYLDPRNESRQDDNYVFASPYKKFALCFAGKPWNDSILNVSYYNGKLMITELKKGSLKKIYDTKGYIYTVYSSGFTKKNNREYISKNKVKIIKSETINNVYDEIMNDKEIEVYEFPNKPSWMKED